MLLYCRVNCLAEGSGMCRLENRGFVKELSENAIVSECMRRLILLCECQIRVFALLSSMKATITILLYIIRQPMTAFVGGKAKGLRAVRTLTSMSHTGEVYNFSRDCQYVVTTYLKKKEYGLRDSLSKTMSAEDNVNPAIKLTLPRKCNYSALLVMVFQ